MNAERSTSFYDFLAELTEILLKAESEAQLHLYLTLYTFLVIPKITLTIKTFFPYK